MDARRNAGAHTRTCITDANGNFRMAGLKPGVHRVIAPGFNREANCLAMVTLEEEDLNDQVLTFDVPPPLAIVVEDANGKGVSGVRVHFDYSGLKLHSSASTLETDANGCAEIGGLPASGGVLRLTASDGARGTARVKIDFDDARPPIRLRLEPNTDSNIVGRIVTATGEPIEDAVVAHREQRVTCVTTAQGEFQLTARPGVHEIFVQAGVAGEARVSCTTAASEVIRLGDIVVEFPLSAGFRGQVLDPAGDPVARADIRLRAVAARGRGAREDEFHGTTTNQQGWFSVEVSAGEFDVVVQSDDLRLPEPLEGLRPGRVPLEIWLETKTRWTAAGRVIASGIPLEGARVRYYRWPDERFNYGDEGVSTGLGGTFEFEGIQSRRIVVVAQHSTFAFARSEALTMPAHGERVDDIEVIPVEGRDLKVRVLSSTGEPAAGIRIHVEGQSKPPPEVWGRTDATGRWNVARLPTGVYKIEATARDQADRRLRAKKTFSWNEEQNPTIELVLQARD